MDHPLSFFTPRVAHHSARRVSVERNLQHNRIFFYIIAKIILEVGFVFRLLFCI